MGSPVSAVIANLYMESFKQQAITSLSYTTPESGNRHHVDDTFTIMDHGNVENFLQHLNNQQPSIRFTMHTENDYNLVYFDTTVSKTQNARLANGVYRNPTHTDQCSAYQDSHHP